MPNYGILLSVFEVILPRPVGLTRLAFDFQLAKRFVGLGFAFLERDAVRWHDEVVCSQVAARFREDAPDHHRAALSQVISEMIPPLRSGPEIVTITCFSGS
jgi:hypothetical protein